MQKERDFVRQFKMDFILCSFLLSVLGFSLYFLFSDTKRRKLLNKIPGPQSVPILGTAYHFNTDNVEIFETLVKLASQYKPVFLLWFLNKATVVVQTAEAAQPILNSNKIIDKSYEYNLLHPWLGTGLLTSKGQKWHSRRKLLTPTFHFKILEEFVDIFQENSKILVEKLKGEVGNEKFNLFSYITLCALDNICESVMGRKIHAQENSDSEYVRAVYKLANILILRNFKPWFRSDWLFNLTALSREYADCLNILHGFTDKIVQERKEELQRQKEGQEEGNENVERDEYGISKQQGQKKKAFLDILIHSSLKDPEMTNLDIREEVDTFMFAGQDTISTGISWCLYLLGCNPHIQDRVVEEMNQVTGDFNRSLTLKDLSELKYLECCMKEAQRIYPSVPYFGRETNEDMNVLGHTIPAGTSVIVFTYMLHRNPEVFPNPEVFDPENFMPQNTEGRHPYAFVPFSAGPRNCIGQKFAMIEEKIVISHVLKHYRVESVDKREDLALSGELVLRPKGGLHVRIFPRK